MSSQKFGAMRMKLLAYTRSILGRAQRARRGQSLVEFALLAPLFFLLVFAITDLGRLFFTKATLQHALREAGRYAVTGQKQDPTREESIRKIAQKYAVGLLPNAADIQIQSISGGVTNNSAGGPNATIIVSLNTELKLITPMIGRYFGPDGKCKLTVSTSFKNEPF